MFKLAKLAVTFVLFVAFVAFGLLVKLGDKTLFGHLRAIGQSRESQDLVRGTKAVTQPIVDRLKQAAVAQARPGDGGAHDVRAADAGASPAPPADHLTDDDRARLRGVLGGAGKKKSGP